MRIIGVDPGSRRTGYGILEIASGGKLVPLAHDTVKPPEKAPLPERLVFIHARLCEVFDQFAPDVMAVEEIFFSRDVRSALTLGQVRGVILLTGMQKGVVIVPYAATVIKQAVSGSGRADKGQVQRMVSSILSLKEKPLFDAADALALAICHANSYRMKGYDRLPLRKGAA